MRVRLRAVADLPKQQAGQAASIMCMLNWQPAMAAAPEMPGELGYTGDQSAIAAANAPVGLVWRLRASPR